MAERRVDLGGGRKYKEGTTPGGRRYSAVRDKSIKTTRVADPHDGTGSKVRMTSHEKVTYAGKPSTKEMVSTTYRGVRKSPVAKGPTSAFVPKPKAQPQARSGSPIDSRNKSMKGQTKPSKKK